MTDALSKDCISKLVKHLCYPMGTTSFLSLWSGIGLVNGIKEKTGCNRQQLVLPVTFFIFCKYYLFSKIYFCKT